MKNIEQGITQKIETLFVNALKNIFGVSIFFISMAMLFEVFTRYFFGVSHGDIAENCQILFIWSVFCLICVLTKEDGHINVGMVLEVLKNHGKMKLLKVLYIISDLTEILFGVVFLYCGSIDVKSMVETGARSYFAYVPPNWTFHLALPMGSLFLIYFSVRRLIQRFAA